MVLHRSMCVFEYCSELRNGPSIVSVGLLQTSTGCMRLGGSWFWRRMLHKSLHERLYQCPVVRPVREFVCCRFYRLWGLNMGGEEILVDI